MTSTPFFKVYLDALAMDTKKAEMVRFAREAKALLRREFLVREFSTGVLDIEPHEFYEGDVNKLKELARRMAQLGVDGAVYFEKGMFVSEGGNTVFVSYQDMAEEVLHEYSK